MSDRPDFGVRQGTLIVPESVGPDDFLFGAPETKEGDVLVVVTQSCDILNCGSEAEPYLEVLVGRRVNRASGRFTHGKHSRRYHVVCGCGHEYCYDLRVKDRNYIRRECLGQLKKAECSLPEASVKALAQWQGRRYFRTAFPTAFDSRIPKEIRAQLSALIESTHQLILGIYFQLNTRKELPAEEPYHVKIYVVVLPDTWKHLGSRQTVLDFATKLESLIDCEGISVEECEATPADNLDLYTVATSLPFDQFNFLSDEEGTDAGSDEHS